MINILVPETVVIKNLVTEEPILTQDTNEQFKISFYTFVVGNLLRDQKSFGADAVTVMHAIDIKDKLKSAAPNTYIEIEKEAYDLLVAALKNMTNLNTEVVMQLGSFLKAILSPDKP